MKLRRHSDYRFEAYVQGRRGQTHLMSTAMAAAAAIAGPIAGHRIQQGGPDATRADEAALD